MGLESVPKMFKIGALTENVMAFCVSRDICYAAVVLTTGQLRFYRILDEEGKYILSTYNGLAVPLRDLSLPEPHRHVLDIHLYKK